jgi:alpha-tubulin suppressor-like RCC1 family protein
VPRLKGHSITAISAGYAHSSAVTASGQLYVWGSAANGKLGLGPLDPKFEGFSHSPTLVNFPDSCKIAAVSCGSSHTAAVTSAGLLFVWGSTDNGRLGIPLPAGVRDVPSPTLVTSLVDEDVYIQDVSCGNAHTLALSRLVYSSTGAGLNKVSLTLGGTVYQCGNAMVIGRVRCTAVPCMLQRVALTVACVVAYM